MSLNHYPFVQYFIGVQKDHPLRVGTNTRHRKCDKLLPKASITLSPNGLGKRVNKGFKSTSKVASCWGVSGDSDPITVKYRMFIRISSNNSICPDWCSTLTLQGTRNVTTLHTYANIYWRRIKRFRSTSNFTEKNTSVIEMKASSIDKRIDCQKNVGRSLCYLVFDLML